MTKLVTVVTKWSINREFMRELAAIPNLFLVITITGNRPPVEGIPPEVHLRSLALAREFNVRCLPMCHPYIGGVSDLSFVSQLAGLEYRELCTKGLRYNPETMGNWMPESSKKLYKRQGIEETLPDDGWQKIIEESGMKLLSPKQWYWREGFNLSPKLAPTEAEQLVNILWQSANVASSANSSEVLSSAISRQLQKNHKKLDT